MQDESGLNEASSVASLDRVENAVREHMHKKADDRCRHAIEIGDDVAACSQAQSVKGRSDSYSVRWRVTTANKSAGMKSVVMRGNYRVCGIDELRAW
jgi:hypothetical protein